MYRIEKNESEAISSLRVLFTIMIVYIHSRVGSEKLLSVGNPFYGVEYTISEIICRCAVPGFFLISAIMLYRKPFKWKDNMRKKVRSILVPYLIMNSFWVVFVLIAKKISFLSGFFNTPASDIYNWGITGWLNAYLGFDGLPILGQTWFLRDLFIINILAVVLKKIIDKFPVPWLILMTLIWISGIESPIFCLSVRAVYFFSLGYYIVKYDFRISDINRISWKLICPLFLLTAGGDLFFSLYTSHDFFTKSASKVCHQIMILLGLALFTQAALRFQKIKQTMVYRQILKYNFCIYLFHEMNMTIIRKLIYKVAGPTEVVQIVTYFLLPVVMIAGCILFSMLLQKVCPRVFGLITGSRTKPAGA